MKLVIFILVLMSHDAFATERHKGIRSVAMSPGDTMTLTYQPGSEVKVSRKGVVDIFPLSETEWQLTALRGGLVIIDAYDTAGQPQLPRMFVDVQGPSSEGRPPVTVGLPDWICQEKGLRCIGDSGIVSGMPGDFRWFLRASAWCNSTRNCTLFVNLSAEENKRMRKYFKERLPTYTLTVSDTGRISASAPCEAVTAEQHARLIEAAVPRMLEDKVLTFQCDTDQDSYRVTVKARKISSSDGESLGYEGKLSHQIAAPPSYSRWAASSSLNADAVHAQQETLGAPQFLATGGTEFQTLIGGELPYISDAEGRAETYKWKEYGLSIKGMIRGRSPGTDGSQHVRGQFEIFLKSINEQSAGGLLSSSLRTNSRIPAEKWTLLGELDLSSDMIRDRFVPGLASVPIIGPLFRLKGAARATSKLQIWAFIEALP